MRAAAGLSLALLALLLLASPLGADWTQARPEGATVAAGTATVLGGTPGLAPPALGMTLVNSKGEIVDAHSLVKGPTFLFYYSASCPHCQHVAPEIAALATGLAGKVTFVGVGSGSNSVGELDEFKVSYKLPFDSWKDYTRRFARDNAATSTPQLLLVRPAGDGFETLGEWRPFAGGMALLAEMRALTVLGADPFTAFRAGEYHGANACGACHDQELRSWGLTHHSVAYWTLYDRKEAANAECVRCHVTGFGQPNGFVLNDHGSHLADVTCESCHGPGGAHAGGAAAASASREACVGCHDADHSVRFSLERALPHVDHFRKEAMDPEAFRVAREALLEGRAPRPLTAFPEGKNLGNSACTGCHAKEVKAFASDPHSKALRTLASKKSADDPSCIGCHATAAKSPAKAAADFHKDGVGCESCHGPGEQHVAAGGGVENIVGLGSSCPVCIVEAICTQCHTPDQDPDWDLDSALKKLTPHSKK